MGRHIVGAKLSEMSNNLIEIIFRNPLKSATIAILGKCERAAFNYENN
jgi:hypothetical protein